MFSLQTGLLQCWVFLSELNSDYPILLLGDNLLYCLYCVYLQVMAAHWQLYFTASPP